MHIRRLNRYTFDVFFGNGWMNWTRVRKGHHGVFVVQGNRLPRQVLKEVQEVLK